MSKIKYIIVITLTLFIAGCVRSLFPLFTEDDLYFNPKLIGTWIEKDGKNSWTFEKAEGKEYILKHYESEFEESSKNKVPGDTAKFIAHLGKIGKYYFLDIFPGKPETNVKNGFYNFHLFPVHTISKIFIGSDTLKLSMLDNDWLAKMIDRNAFKIPHARLSNQIILTASTNELQRLVRRYAENSKAFPSPAILRKVK